MSTARIDRDAHVGGAQRRRVVDAVAEEADDVPLALQRPDYPLLVGRREPGKQRGVFGGLGQLVVGHRLNLPAEQDLIGRPARPPCRSCG